MSEIQSFLVFLFVIVDLWSVQSFSSPRDTILKTLNDAKSSPLATTALLVPPELLSPDVVFKQADLGRICEGSEKLIRASNSWDIDFQSDLGVDAAIDRVAAISENTFRVKWNVTWVPPTALWLESIGRALGPSVETLYVSYNHLARQPSTFSWSAVFKLFRDILAEQKLRVPLACIEGNTELIFSDKSCDQVVRVTESLAYATDLRLGVLQNRKCSQDLRLFLEVGRRLTDDPEEWYIQVSKDLPWESVPGSNPLDVDPVEEGPIAAVGFLGFVALTVGLFATLVAPELIGQNLMGPPTYIVRPENLNDLY